MKHISGLFDPDADGIPVHQTAEPEAISDVDSYAPHSGRLAGQLFNHRRDDDAKSSVNCAWRQHLVVCSIEPFF